MPSILNKEIPIVIPSYQPDNRLLDLCEQLKQCGLCNVLIVDDGSGEQYQPIFQKIRDTYGFTLITHTVNQGKGRALKTAFSHIIEQGNAIGCVTADSDGQHTPKDILKCITALQENPTSLILGCRDFSGEDVPSKSKFGNNLTRKIFSYLCGIQVSDTQTGLRAIPLQFMQHLLDVAGERFEFETNMLIECKDRIKIKEIPIQTIYDSKENHQTHFNPIVDSFKIYRIFAKMFLKYIFSSFSACIIDLVLFSIFCSLTRSAFPAFYLIVSTVAARLISATYNCLINYHLVFKTNKEKKSVRSSIIRYFILAAIQMTLSAAFVTFFATLVRHAISDTLVKMIVDVLLFFVSYHIQLKYVF